MYTLKMTYEFTQGNLKGMTYDASIPYPTYKRCEQHVKGVNKNNKKKTCDYKILNFEIVNP